MHKINSENINFIKQFVSKKQVAFLLVLSVINSLLIISVAFLTKNIISAVQVSNTQDITMYSVLSVALLLLFALASYLLKFLTVRYSLLSTQKAVAYSHNKLIKSNYQKVVESHSVEQLKIVSNDADIAVSSYISLFPTIASTVVKLIVGTALMLYISYQITLVLMAVGLVIGVIVIISRKLLKNLHKKVQQNIAKSNAYMQETLKNIEVEKALDISDYVKTGVNSKLDKVRFSIEKRTKYYSGLNNFIGFVLEATFVFLLVYGGFLIINGTLALADFIVLIGLIGIIKAPFMQATTIIEDVYMMLASAERVINVIKNNEDEYVIGDFDKLVFENVSYKYNDKNVISNFNLTIDKNEKLLICGKSGKGKTTLIRLLLGVLSPTDGNIYLEKGDKKTLLNGKLLKLGYVPQNLQLFNDTVLNNLVVGKDISQEKVIESLKFVDLYDDIIKKPDGLNYMLKENGTGLSQGQMQRLAIARAYLQDNDILLLDEPFASIDDKVSIDIYNKLLELNKTVIIVSHDAFIKDSIKNVVNLESIDERDI